MIGIIITLFLLIQSCNSGSSSSSSSKCKKEQGSFAKFWSIVEMIIGFICSLNGIWNTIEHWLEAYRNAINGTPAKR
ncbi:unnamed protein product [Schistosoma spindalis]|nr:unnamed protein product [Schistosoma spindale]